MIQFNLLPDVKLNFVKTQRLKHTITIVSIIATGVSVGIMVILLLIVDVAQKSYLNSLNNKITTSVASLKNTPHLDTILTNQAELTSLNTLDEAKPVVTRIPTYLADLIPSYIGISSINFVFSNEAGQSNANNTVTIQGVTAGLTQVNQFVDILKLSTYTTPTVKVPTNVFTNVSLGNFGYSSTGGSSFDITASFDPVIFANPGPAGTTPVINLPSSIVTQSTAVESQDLFVDPSQSNLLNNGSGN